MKKCAIIGGTGIYSMKLDTREVTVSTEYGDVFAEALKIGGDEIIFLPRHGRGHQNPPHLINYRANIMALKLFGVDHIFATAAVGSCNKNFRPGELVLIKDYLDFTNGRETTFFDGGTKGVAHVSMEEPSCEKMIDAFKKQADINKLNIAGEAVYVCTQGPRFETQAEIEFFKSIGGDVVGMTALPEMPLARELGMSYASVGIITNWCTGMTDKVEGHEIKKIMQENGESLINCYVEAIKSGELDNYECDCKDKLIKL